MKILTASILVLAVGLGFLACQKEEEGIEGAAPQPTPEVVATPEPAPVTTPAVTPAPIVTPPAITTPPLGTEPGPTTETAAAGASQGEMLAVKAGQPAPDFTLPASNDAKVSLASFKGRELVLYFYPKDDTPGCTKEACGFRDEIKAIQKKDADVVGVSKDSIADHKAFIQKHDLPFILLSDAKGEVAKKYGALSEKGGVKRMTFVIDQQGKIKKVFPNVRVEDHAKEVIAALD